MNVYPTLQGLSWPVSRKPLFNVIKQETVSGRVVAGTYMQYPLYEFGLAYSYLSTTDLAALEGFFLAQGGDLTPFYFNAGKGDNSVYAVPFGTGDGTTKAFQLLRAVGAYSEPVAATFGSRNAYVSGVSKSASFDTPTPGWVTFDTAPASGAALTWDGGYYYLCRFKHSAQSFDEFMSLLYSAGDVTLRTCRL